MKPNSLVGVVLAGGVLLCSLGLTACGDDDDDSGPPAAGGQPAAGGATDTGGAADDTPTGGGDGATMGGSGAGGAGSGTGTGSCDLPVIGTWKAGGKTYEAQTGLFTSFDPAPEFNFNLVACGGSDALVQFEVIPALEPGSYPLTYTILHGKPANGDGGAFYSDPDQKTFFTDDTHTGTFEITAVDETAHTFSADFSFTGKADDGETLEISDGHIIDAKY